MTFQIVNILHANVTDKDKKVYQCYLTAIFPC